ncbi:MAG: MarR family winged helix-turn-helix transcriptional regulator [Ilumatobacteraceae bacterium]|jgi:DNA-binding MarR family transcriptional regulator
MARLDARRVAAWRGLQARVGEVERAIDAALREEWDISLAWFDVLAALQRAGGAARPGEIAGEIGLPVSSLSRRLDRLEEDGWVVRRRPARAVDHRAVEVVLTRRGRNLWRAMNVTYRRAVQAEFAVGLGDGQVAILHEVIDHLTPEPPVPVESDDE